MKDFRIQPVPEWKKPARLDFEEALSLRRWTGPLAFFKLFRVPWSQTFADPGKYVGEVEDGETGWWVYDFKYLDGRVYYLRPRPGYGPIHDGCG